jgi:ABC-type enterochelin transport system permease subunit
VNFFDGVTDVFDSVSDFFSTLLDPNTYVRIFYVIFGAVLIWGALYYGR